MENTQVMVISEDLSTFKFETNCQAFVEVIDKVAQEIGGEAVWLKKSGLYDAWCRMSSWKPTGEYMAADQNVMGAFEEIFKEIMGNPTVDNPSIDKEQPKFQFMQHGSTYNLDGEIPFYAIVSEDGTEFMTDVSPMGMITSKNEDDVMLMPQHAAEDIVRDLKAVNIDLFEVRKGISRKSFIATYSDFTDSVEIAVVNEQIEWQ